MKWPPLVLTHYLAVPSFADPGLIPQVTSYTLCGCTGVWHTVVVTPLSVIWNSNTPNDMIDHSFKYLLMWTLCLHDHYWRLTPLILSTWDGSSMTLQVEWCLCFSSNLQMLRWTPRRTAPVRRPSTVHLSGAPVTNHDSSPTLILVDTDFCHQSPLTFLSWIPVCSFAWLAICPLCRFHHSSLCDLVTHTCHHGLCQP
jgi:hypothetical protein